MPWNRAVTIGFLTAIGMLGGCNSSNRLAGLDPVLNDSAVEQASSTRQRILNALAADAGLRVDAIDWYLVTEAGFNYIQDQCTAYFDELYRFDRTRDAVKSGLAASGQTSAALLAITGAAAPSIAASAQAFGLASSLSDVVGGTYLFRRPPASAQTLVERLQLAFRDGAVRQRPSINSPTAAYYYIQRFLSLCLPSRIEAEIDRQISATQVVAVDQGPGSPFSLEMITAPSPGLTERFGPLLGERSQYYPPDFGKRRKASDATSLDQPPLKVVRNARTSTEKRISIGVGVRIEEVLCQSSEADLGEPGSPRREALRTFKSVFVPFATDTVDNALDLQNLQRTIKQYMSCQASGFLSPYEVGLWMRYGAKEILRLVRAAETKQGGGPSLSDTAADTGPSLELRAALKKLDPTGKGVITPAFWKTIVPQPL